MLASILLDAKTSWLPSIKPKSQIRFVITTHSYTTARLLILNNAVQAASRIFPIINKLNEQLASTMEWSAYATWRHMCKHVRGLMGNHLARVLGRSRSWEIGWNKHRPRCMSLIPPVKVKPIPINVKRASDLDLRHMRQSLNASTMDGEDLNQNGLCVLCECFSSCFH